MISCLAWKTFRPPLSTRTPIASPISQPGVPSICSPSGDGTTSAHGPTLNPHRPEYCTGGSSCGSGAALYYDWIDIAIGTDQGGSIRMPSSWSGVVGIKPTYGLVPYTGVMSIDPSLDHVGPMARGENRQDLDAETPALRMAPAPRDCSWRPKLR